jgi:hypothetical protein
VSIETFNGDVSNNDYQNLNNDILKLGAGDPSKGEIELTMNKPYDRIKINVNGGLLSLGGEFRVYYDTSTEILSSVLWPTVKMVRLLWIKI